MNKYPQLKRFIIGVVLILSSIVIGVVGYSILEGFSLFDAFYMTIITISTVGFSEIHELSTEGRIFTSFYIIFNLSIFAYGISMLTTYVFEGKLQQLFRNYMTDRELAKLKNHAIVCGYGRNGSQACVELRDSNIDFVVIDNDEEILSELALNTNFKVLFGDATQDNTLKNGGIEDAAVIIITTASDASNVYITLTARELNPEIKIISRASGNETESKLYRAGANRVVMPDKFGGMIMAQMYTKPVVIEFLDLVSGRSRKHYHLESLAYDELKPEFKDKTLKELNIHEHTGGTVIGVKDDIKGLIPSPGPETLIGKEDTIIVLGNNEHLERLRDYFGTKKFKKR